MTNLEQRTQDAKVQEIPKSLLAYCEICKEDRVFGYYAIQRSPFGDAPLYLCTKCKCSKSYNSLMKMFNGRVIEE